MSFPRLRFTARWMMVEVVAVWFWFDSCRPTVFTLSFFAHMPRSSFGRWLVVRIGACVL
jgi:hypothetical protein